MNVDNYPYPIPIIVIHYCIISNFSFLLLTTYNRNKVVFKSFWVN